MKKRVSIIIALSILMVCLTIFLFAKYINPNWLKVNYYSIYDDQITDDFDNISIAFFSDLEYGNYFNEDRLNSLIDSFNILNSDVVIFGGDMFDKNYTPTQTDIQLLTDSLKSIHAPLGKFAIIGDFDMTSTSKLDIIKQILYDADFELLQDNNIKIHNGTNDFINLIGIDYTTNTDIISSYYSSIDANRFTVSIIHGASNSDCIPSNYSNITLSGHSHHCQVFLFRPYKEYPQTSNYTIGLQNTNNTKLYVTSGVGTTQTDYRLFSPSEIMVFRLKKTK